MNEREREWNEICGRGKMEKSEKSQFSHGFFSTKPTWTDPRRELGTLAVRGERLTAYGTELPLNLKYPIKMRLPIMTWREFSKVY